VPRSFRHRKTAIVAAGALGITAIGGGAAVAAGGDDDATETPIAGAALAKATAAALAHTGEGKVTGTEAEDEESPYEVEVTLADGSQVDVQLDADFKVVDSENDGREG
jgi:hypothetical protein